MRLAKYMYEKIKKKPAPYYYDYKISTVVMKPIRKWLTNSVASNCPFNCIRIWLYRISGFKIGKHPFIGMHCYLDDMCYDLLSFGDDVIVSYGVYFACHGRNQGHWPIHIGNRAYIGMRASIISKNKNGKEEGVNIGDDVVIGACTLVNCDIPAGMTAVGSPCRIIPKKEGNNANE